jgi:hypothetical protein
MSSRQEIPRLKALDAGACAERRILLEQVYSEADVLLENDGAKSATNFLKRQGATSCETRKYILDRSAKIAAETRALIAEGLDPTIGSTDDTD